MTVVPTVYIGENHENAFCSNQSVNRTIFLDKNDGFMIFAKKEVEICEIATETASEPFTMDVSFEEFDEESQFLCSPILLDQKDLKDADVGEHIET